MHEYANSLVTRTHEPETLCLGGHAPIRLGDGDGLVVELDEPLVEAIGDARGEPRHVPHSAAEILTEACRFSQVTTCYLA